jgi:transposase
MISRSFRNKRPAEEAVVMFWQLGLDTQQIANRMGASEAGVYNVLAAWREKKHDSDNSAISPECEQALEDEEGW